VDWSGFEPEASGLQNRRSSGLIYQPILAPRHGPVSYAFGTPVARPWECSTAGVASGWFAPALLEGSACANGKGNDIYPDPVDSP
jgi:hypothetical protein